MVDVSSIPTEKKIIMGIDPGTKRIGISLSDPSGTVAFPFSVIEHKSYLEDSEKITEIAVKNLVDLIVVGQSIDPDGKPTFIGKIAYRLAQSIIQVSGIKTILWDEYKSTKKMSSARKAMKLSGSRKWGHHDELSAVVILQDYLDTNPDEDNRRTKINP